MGLQINIENHDQYLYAAVTGDYDLAGLKKYYLQVLNTSIQLSQPRVIFDARSVIGIASVMDRYEFATWLVQVQKPPIRVAIFGLPEQITPDRFAESVAVNRGVQMKVVTTMDEALQWLGVAEAVSAH
jgi:hypothetical protein